LDVGQIIMIPHQSLYLTDVRCACIQFSAIPIFTK